MANRAKASQAGRRYPDPPPGQTELGAGGVLAWKLDKARGRWTASVSKRRSACSIAKSARSAMFTAR